MNRNNVIKGLQCCSQGRNGADCECGSCPYIENTLECKETLAADALEYISELEKTRHKLREIIDEQLYELQDRNCQLHVILDNQIRRTELQ